MERKIQPKEDGSQFFFEPITAHFYRQKTIIPKMLSCVYLVNKDGIILIEKQYREHVARSEVDEACLAIRENVTSQPPSIISRGNYTILLHKEGEIWILGICESDDFAPTPISLLQYIGQLLNVFIPRGLNENTVKDNYPLIYQLLDFAADFGYALFNEPNTIQTLLNRPKTDLTRGIRLQLDLVRPWRQVGVSYFVNDIYIDVTETIDIVVSQFGKTEFCHIRGRCEVNSQLSGDPSLKIVLSPSTHFEDPCYHRCIQLDSGLLSNAKVFQFTPPDGKFTLLTYRISAMQRTVPLFISPKFLWNKGNVTIEIAVKADSQLPQPIDNLEVRFTMPKGVSTPSFLPTEGKTNYDPTTSEVVWSIPSLKVKEESTILKGSASMPLDFELGGRFPIVSATFSTKGMVPSGFHVDDVQVDNIKYKVNAKGVKYLTEAGSYEFRTGLC